MPITCISFSSKAVVGFGGAMCALAERAGADVVGCAFVIELAALGGRERLAGRDVRSLVVYEED